MGEQRVFVSPNLATLADAIRRAGAVAKSSGAEPPRKTFSESLVEYQCARLVAEAQRREPRLRKSAGPTPTAVTRRVPAPRPAQPPAPITMLGTKTRWIFGPEGPAAGAVVRFNHDGEVHHGKLVDWGPAGARVATRRGHAQVAWDDLRPVSEDELCQLREQQDRDQEERFARSSMFGTDDIRPGHLATAIDLDHDQQTAGTVVSVSHGYPQHVVLRSLRDDGSAQLTVHPLDHVREIREPEP
jgi:hypothetical protein